jgi:L,D-transpeptidase catalytic domain/Putative peptidoglycan binding domain
MDGHQARPERLASRTRRRVLAAGVGLLVAGGLTVGAVLNAGVALAAPGGTVTAVSATGGRVLRIGMQGPDVLALQRRLGQLHYVPGSLNGVFGNSTFHAVVAFQKVNGIARDGQVGPQTRAKLAHPVAPRLVGRRSGMYVEINLTRQVMVIGYNRAVFRVLDVATGSGRPYVSGGSTHIARTPVGDFRIQRKINAWRTSTLGRLWRPAYFYGGYAIHGSYSVPAYPASHGCVRVTIANMDRMYSTLRIGTPVKVYR